MGAATGPGGASGATRGAAGDGAATGATGDGTAAREAAAPAAGRGPTVPFAATTEVEPAGLGALARGGGAAGRGNVPPPVGLAGGGRGAAAAGPLRGAPFDGAPPGAPTGGAAGDGAGAAFGALFGRVAAGTTAGGGANEASAGGARLRASPASGGSLSKPLDAAMALDTWIMKPHLRHFMRTDRPATFSSAIWYFALQLGQRNFIQRSAVARGLGCSRNASDPSKERALSLARAQKGALQKKNKRDAVLQKIQ
jgi:hypothetical protein